MKILIAEDDFIPRRLLENMLLKRDFEVIVTQNGAEAMAALSQKGSPQLAILDWMMPELDGFGVLDELKADAETATIPVIVSTAKELTPAEKDKLKGQIQSLLQKGDFMSDEFLDEVRTIIR